MPRWRRTIAIGVVSGLAIAAAFAVGYIAFFPKRIVVYGPSMAETLRGTHGELTCRECKFTFCFDAELAPVPSRLVCPNCGHVHVDDSSVRIQPPDRLRITPYAPGQTPQRFELVSHYVPDFPEKQAVKRIIGLPGETVAIRQGEVFINGQPLLRDRALIDELKVIVHNSSHPGKRARWEATSSPDVWQEEAATATTEHRLVARLPQPAEEFARLMYRHYPPVDLPASAIHPQAISDFDAYNAHLARELNPSFNLRLEARVVFDSPAAIVAVRMHDGWQWWQLELDKSAKRCRLWSAHEEVAQQTLPEGFGDGVAVGSEQGNLWWALNASGVQIELRGTTSRTLTGRSAHNSEVRVPQLDQIAFGIRQGQAHFTNVRISRDIHYLAPDNTGRVWSLERPLGPDEYFLLGDNPPVSIDSRHYGPIHREQLRGVVTKLK